jgi:hypothetical protein
VLDRIAALPSALNLCELHLCLSGWPVNNKKSDQHSALQRGIISLEISHRLSADYALTEEDHKLDVMNTTHNGFKKTMETMNGAIQQTVSNIEELDSNRSRIEAATKQAEQQMMMAASTASMPAPKKEEKKSNTMMIAGGLVVVLGAGGFYMYQQQQKTAAANAAAAAAAQPLFEEEPM